MAYLIQFMGNVYHIGGGAASPSIDRAVRYKTREEADAACAILCGGAVVSDATHEPTSEIAAAVRAERARCIAACRKVAASGTAWTITVEACIAEIQKGVGR